MTNALKTTCLAAALFISPGALGQEIDPAPLEALLADAISDDAPGLAVGIVLDGEIVFEHYGGLADLENAIPVGEQTRFNIASNAKQFTALTALYQIEAGDLSLDDSFRSTVPELYPDLEADITVRDLIVHSSGLRDFYDLWSLQGLTWWAEFVGNDDAIALLAQQRDLNFAPDTQHLYSNSNYTVLVEILERRSDQSLAELTRPMFDNLGMTNTAFTMGHMDIIPNRARGYANFGQWVAYPAVTDLYGDGWLRTTLPDQLRYEQRVQRAEEGSILSVSQGPVEGSSVQSYGYGLELSTYRGLAHIYHDGSTGAHNASVSRYPDHDLSIIVMSNSGQVSTRFLTTQIANLVLEGAFTAPGNPEYPETLLDRPDNTDVLGLYVRENTPTPIRVTEVEGELVREFEGRDPARLLHDRGNVFEYETTEGLRAAFDETATGQGRMTIFYASQEPLIYLRENPAPLSESYLRSLTGTFENDETGSRMVVRFSNDGGLVIEALGGSEAVTLTVEDQFIVYGQTLRAIRDDAGQVSHYELSNNRLRRVRYDRVNP